MSRDQGQQPGKKEQQSAAESWKLWNRARSCIAESTVDSLNEAVELINSASNLISAPSIRAMLYHDQAIAFWRLAKKGNTENTSKAIAVALQACLLDVNWMLQEGHADDLERDANLLSDILRTDGVTRRDLHDTQILLDRYFTLPLADSTLARIRLQEAVATAYLSVADETNGESLRANTAEAARDAFKKAIDLVETLQGRQPAEQYMHVYANDVFYRILESRTIAQLHFALDRAFEIERSNCLPGTDSSQNSELSYKARVVFLVQKQAAALVSTLDRARLRSRLWAEWGSEWLNTLGKNTGNSGDGTQVHDWIQVLLQAEQEEMLRTANASPNFQNNPIPDDTKNYTTSLLMQAGYPPALLALCVRLAFGVAPVTSESLLVEPFISIFKKYPDDFSKLVGVYRQLSLAIVQAQRGNVSCIRDLESLAVLGNPLLAGLVATTGLEIAQTIDNADLALKALKIARRMLAHHADASSFELLASGVTLSMRQASSRQQAWMEEALDWAATLVSVSEQRIASSTSQGQERLTLLYGHAWAVLHLTKAQANLDTELAKQKLDLSIELVANFEREAQGAAVALVLKSEILRVEAQLAIAREDYETAFYKCAEEVRLITEHPELNFGPPLISAVNLLMQALNVPPSSLASVKEVVRAASSIALRDIPATIALGRSGLDALVAIASERLRRVVSISDQDAADLISSIKLHPDVMRRQPEAIDVGAVQALNPFHMTINEALQWYSYLVDQRHVIPALTLMLQWLGVNVDRPIYGRRAQLIHHAIARELATLMPHIPDVPADLQHFARYIAGETARFAGLWGAAEEWLGAVYREAQAIYDSGGLLAQATLTGTDMGTGNLTWPEAVECDYAGVMVVISCRDGRQEVARRWLDIIERNIEAREASRILSLAGALVRYVKAFGSVDVNDKLMSMVHRLSGEPWHGPGPSLEQEANHLVAAVELALLSGQVDLLDRVKDKLQLVLQRDLPARLEASMRRARVDSLIALGQTLELRAELERLTFLQDVEAGSVAGFDSASYEDFAGDSSIRIAWAALDLDEPALALDALERGRLTILFRLRESVETAYHNPSDTAVMSSVQDGYGKAQMTEEAPAVRGAGLNKLGSTDHNDPELLRPVHVFNALGSGIEQFAIPAEAWKRVFRNAGAREVLEAAKQAGIIAYQIVHEAKLRIVFAVGNELVVTEGLDVPDASTCEDMMDPVFRAIRHAWHNALLSWRHTEPEIDSISPTLISIGERSELAWMSELAVDECMRELGIAQEKGNSQGLVQVPSIRLLGNGRSGRKVGNHRQGLLHIGDLSNTLIGPWLESAAITAVPGLDTVASVMTGDLSISEFRTMAAEVSILVASCHGAYDPTGLVATSLGIGTEGLSIVDIVGSGALDQVEMLFLAACEMGRRAEEIHERESVSFANAVLVGGCKYVVAPALPVNDLVSAVLVSHFCRSLPTLGSVGAYRAAVRTVRSMTARDFSSTVSEMWKKLQGSSLSEAMPWPADAVGRVIDRRVGEVIAGHLWQYVPFTISVSNA